VVEGPLHAGRPVGVALLVRREGGAEARGEGGHLRHRHHVRPRAREHDHVRVVDHPPQTGAFKVQGRLRQEHLALEAGEARIELEEEHPRVAERRRGRLGASRPAPDHHVVRRRVVLHLLARLEVVPSDRLGRRVTDSVPPAVRRQGLIREPRARAHELLVHAHEVVLAPGHELQDLLPVRLGLLGPRHLRHLRRAGLEDLLDRATRDLERSRDRPCTVSFFTQPQDRDPGALVVHRRAPW
jgi:hypothetical protein